MWVAYSPGDAGLLARSWSYPDGQWSHPRTSKLLQAAEDRWRYVNCAHLVALGRVAARFRNTVLVDDYPQDREAVA